MHITQPNVPINRKLNVFVNLLFNITLYENLYMEVEFSIMLLYNSKNKWEKDFSECIDGKILKIGNNELDSSQSSKLITFYKDTLKKDIWGDIENHCQFDIDREINIFLEKLNNIKWQP